LSFADTTAQLILHNASLVTTCSGLQLLNGTLMVEGLSYFSSPITIAQTGTPTKSDGITLGNGNSTSDCICLISSGAQLVISQGSLNYSNSNPSSLIMQNNFSTIYCSPGASLVLYQTANVGGIFMQRKFYS
jgi:hypothetical protein